MIIEVSTNRRFELRCNKCGNLDMEECGDGYYCCDGQCDGFYSYDDIAEIMILERNMFNEKDDTSLALS